MAVGAAPESPEETLAHLRSTALGRDLILELERSLPGWRASLSAVGGAAISVGQVLQGLAYLAGSGPFAPPKADIVADHALITGAPRSAAYLALFHYLLSDADPFNLSLLPALEPLAEGREPLLPVAARLAVLAAAADMAERANARGLDGQQVAAARERVRELTFADPAGVYLSDLPDLAYDLRLACYYSRGYSFSLQSFYGPIAVLDCPGPPGRLALPLDGTRFGPDGYLAPPDSRNEGGWTARVQRHGSTLEANTVVGVDGLGRRRALLLDMDGVSTALQSGDDALELHVERGADLTADTWHAALTETLDHYRHHFPERRPRAVFMVSWLLDPVVRSLLPDTARILRFQSLFRLYPARYDEAHARDCVLAAPASRPTSLQRALLDLERVGGRLREGGGFLLLP